MLILFDNIDKSSSGARAPKVTQALTLALTVPMPLADATRKAMESLGKTPAPERVEEVLLLVRVEVLDRLHSTVSHVWPMVREDIFKGAEGALPPTLDVETVVPEQLFRYFCFETCCTHRDNLREWNASFTGRAAIDWFVARTSDKAPDAFARALAQWEKNGWLECGGQVPLQASEFLYYSLSASGMTTWNNTTTTTTTTIAGSKIVRTPEEYRKDIEGRAASLVEETDEAYSRLALQAPQVMSSAQLVQLVSEGAEVMPLPLERAIELAGRLVALQYVVPVKPEHKDAVFEVQAFSTTGGEAPEYVIADLREPFVLNMRRGFFGAAGSSGISVGTSLWEFFRNKGLVMAKRDGSSWTKFSAAVLELQRVHAPVPAVEGWAEQARAEATCFWVNIFNLLSMHASYERARLPPLVDPEENAAYNVGGLSFSLRVIRRGILGGDRSVFPSADDPRAKCVLDLKGELALPLLCLYLPGFPSEVVLTPQNMESEWEPRTRDLLADAVDVSGADNTTWTLPNGLEYFVKVHGGKGLEIAQLLFACLPASLQVAVEPALQAKKEISIVFANAEEFSKELSTVDLAASKSDAGSILFALTNARAKLALMKATLSNKQRDFEATLHDQQDLKSSVFSDDATNKKFDTELKHMQAEQSKYQHERSVKKAAVLEQRAALIRTQVVAEVAHDLLSNLFKDYLQEDDDYKAELENAYQKCLGAIKQVMVDPVGEPLVFREPLKRAQSEAYTRVATERHRVNWLKERGREHLPFFPQDEGFVDSLILAHAELIDESVPLDRWASQGLIATYGRFCSTWKERISEVQKMLQKLDVSTRELADGWEVTEAIYAGMLVYAKVPAAEAAVSQLIKMMEVDPKLVDIAQEFPRLSKIAMPGRFLIARGMVSCARGTSSALVANLILCNDILVAHFVGVDIYVHTLELCVVIQDEKAFTIEVLDSSVHIPMKMDLKSKEAFMKWNKWLNFGTMMAKSQKVRTLGGKSSSKWNMSREPDAK